MKQNRLLKQRTSRAEQFSPLAAKSKSYHKRKNMELILLSLPALILLFLMCYVPLPGLVLAFKNFSFIDGVFNSPWVGFNNFKFIFSTPDALNALRNTILYNVVFIVTLIGGSVLLAILFNEILSTRFLKIYQTTLFLPYFLSWSVVTYIVLSLLDNDRGLINGLLTSIGLEKTAFYFEPEYWPFIHVVLHFWKNAGYNMLLYYAAIIAIDPSFYEAARIDGASRRQMAWKITIPCIMPMIVITFLNQVGRMFYSDFGQFFMVPQESPMLTGISSTLDTYVYSALRGSADIGMGAAAGLFQSVAGFTLVILVNAFVRRKFGRERAMF